MGIKRGMTYIILVILFSALAGSVYELSFKKGVKTMKVRLRRWLQKCNLLYQNLKSFIENHIDADIEYTDDLINSWKLFSCLRRYLLTE